MVLSITELTKSEDFLKPVKISKLWTQGKKGFYGLGSGKYFGHMNTPETGNI